VPSASDDGISEIIARLGPNIWELDRSLALGVIDLLRWVDATGPWFGDPDPDHAWQWLLWWSAANDETTVQLATVVGPNFEALSEDSELRAIYSIVSPESAIEAIERALRIQQDLSGLPIPSKLTIPDSVRKLLLERFRLRMATEPLADDFALDEIHSAIRTSIANELVALAKERQSIDRQRFETLERVLGAVKVAELRTHLPIEDPGNVPGDPGTVLAWYQDRYVPWRLRYAEEASCTSERVKELHQQFASWILERLPAMRSHPDHQVHLAWVKVDRLRQNRQDNVAITLLVVADGLGPRDILAIRSALAAEEDLLITECSLAFTQIPTVTELTKPVIVAGDLAGQEVQEQGDRLSKIDTVTASLEKAADGDVLAWTLTQPDREYHFTFGKKELANKVHSRLQEIASGIIDVVRAFDNARSLRVIVTSDHGRYVGETIRSIPTPTGLNSHGRAAWGPAKRQPNSDFEYDGDIVWLNPYSYGLPPESSYAIALGSNSFMTADGKKGTEIHGHGGLSPEEVIVPWLEIRRHVTFAALVLTGSGNGQNRKSGEIFITVANPNHATIKLVSLRLPVPRLTSSDGKSVPAELASAAGSAAALDILLIDLGQQEVNPIDALKRRVELEPWTFLADNEVIQASLTFQLPSGEERRQTVDIHLSTKALYRASLSIEDLQ